MGESEGRPLGSVWGSGTFGPARRGPLSRREMSRHWSGRGPCQQPIVKEGVVKVAALEGLGLLAADLGDRRDTIVRALRERTADKNPMVAKRARHVPRQAFKVDVPNGS